MFVRTAFWVVCGPEGLQMQPAALPHSQKPLYKKQGLELTFKLQHYCIMLRRRHQQQQQPPSQMPAALDGPVYGLQLP